VVSLAERHGLVIVTDEAYEASLWDNAPFTSAFGIGDDVIVIRSLGKSLSMPQLRLGFIAGPAERVARCTRTLEWDCLRVNLASQEAARAALEGPRGWLERIHAAMTADRTVAVAAVAATPGLTAVTPLAAPFLFVGSPAEGFAEQLEAVGLPVVDGAAFEGPGYARLPFGGAAEASIPLHNALDRWAQLHAR
jgi:aspartate aminotransferase